MKMDKFNKESGKNLFAGLDDELNEAAKNSSASGAGKKTIYSAVAAIAAVAILAAGFAWKKNLSSQNSSSAAQQNSAASASAKDNDNKTLSVGLMLAPTNLDIRTQSGSALEQALIGNVYQGLVERAENNEVKPMLASSWDISDDGKEYVFHMCEGAKFSNGDPLTAYDAQWSVSEMIDKKYQGYQYANKISSVEARDEKTLVMKLSSPCSSLLWQLTGRAGLVFDKNASYDPKTQAVGSGPYEVESFSANENLIFKENSQYWTDKNKAAIKRIVLKYYADSAAGLNAFKSAEVQVLTPVDAKFSESIKSDSRFEISAGDGTDKFVLAMNNNRAPLNDVKVREAIRLAVDHEAIIAARRGEDALLAGPIPPLDPGYEDLTSSISYDVDKAKELLEQAGYNENNKLEISLEYANIYGTDLGDQLAAQLAKANIKLNVKVVEFSAWLTDVHKGKNYDLSLVNHTESHDFYQWTMPDYYFGYGNDEVKQLYQKADESLLEDERNEYLKKAARIVSQDSAADWLFYYRIITAWDKSVKNYPLNMNSYLLPLWKVTF